MRTGPAYLCLCTCLAACQLDTTGGMAPDDGGITAAGGSGAATALSTGGDMRTVGSVEQVGAPGGAAIAIGTLDEQAELAYVPLAPAGDLALHTYGQGGMHVAVVVRCEGLGKEAFVDITLRNLGDYDRGMDPAGDGPDAGATGRAGFANYPGEVMTAPRRRPSLLVCDDLLDPQVCTHRPIVVMTGGLTDSVDALDGLHVEIQADVRTEDGLALSDRVDVYLRQ